MTVIKSIYKIEQCIAETMLSYHYVAQTLNESQNIYIVAYKDDFLSSDVINDLISFLETYETVTHPTLLPLVDYHYDGDFFYVMYQFDENLMGLDVYLDKQRSLGSRFVRSVLTQILDGLHYLSTKNIVYGHLNLESIYLTQDSKIRLLAPQLSFIILNFNLDALPVIEESVFLAPEVLIGNELDDKVDSYAFSVLMYFLYTGQWPYNPHESLKDAKFTRLKPFISLEKFEDKLPKSVPLIVNRLLSSKSLDRPSVSELYTLYHSSEDLRKVLGNPIEFNTSNQELKVSLDQDRKRSRTKVFTLFNFVLVPILLVLMFMGSYRYFTRTVDTVRVPNLINMTYAKASFTLKSAGLSSQFSGERFHPSIPEGMIVETKPVSGRDVKANRSVKVYISKGPRTVTVDNFVGISLDSAMAMPSSKEISFDIIDEHYSVVHDVGHIISQSTSPNQQLGLDASLDVIVSKGVPVQFAPILTDTDDLNSSMIQFNLAFWVPDYFRSTVVSLIQKTQGSSYTLFTYFFNSGERQDLSYTLDKSSEIELYYDQMLVFKQRL